jgi:hypothetical protein
LIEQGIYKQFSEVVHIAAVTERYCYEDNTYDYCREDVYLTPCIYETGSDTIRLVPENYCLVAFGFEGSKELLETDAATAEYLPVLQECYEDYLKEKQLNCNKNKTAVELKGWLCWLIGETLKERFPGLAVQRRKSLIE